MDTRPVSHANDNRHSRRLDVIVPSGDEHIPLEWLAIRERDKRPLVGANERNRILDGVNAIHVIGNRATDSAPKHPSAYRTCDALFNGGKHRDAPLPPNDPSSATRPAGRHDGN